MTERFDMPKGMRGLIAGMLVVIAIVSLLRKNYPTADELRSINGLLIGVGVFSTLYGLWLISRGVRGWDAAWAVALIIAGVAGPLQISIRDLTEYGVSLPVAFVVPILLALLGYRHSKE